MRSGLKGAVAAFAAAASFAAVGVAPAAAQGTNVTIAPIILPECIQSPDLPTCVNYAIDTVDRQVANVQRTYDRNVRPWLCDVQWILDGQGCV